MLTTLTKCFSLTVMCLLITKTHGFNIETVKETRRSFVWNSNHENLLKQESSNAPFFGYTINADRISAENDEIVSIMVGAPLEDTMVFTTTGETNQGGEAIPSVMKSALTHTKSTGAVYSCVMLVDNFQNSSFSKEIVNCSSKEQLRRSLSGFDMAENDTLGISLTSDKRASAKTTVHMPRDRMVACAHLRAHNCGAMYKTEGTCYVSKVLPGRGDGRYSVEWSERTPCRENCFEQNIDLMFVVDGSESIGKARFETVKDWIVDVAAGFNIKDQTQIGVVQYSHWWRDKTKQKWLRTEVPLGEHRDQKDFAKAVRNISYHGYTTYTAHAIEKTVRDDFNSERSRFPAARRVMILLTDGNSTDKESLPDAVKYAEREGVTSFAVGVKGYVLGELELIAGSEDRVITVDDFDELLGIVSTIQFGIQLMEGSTNSNITNDLMQCQAGISSEISANGRLHLGAVGAYDWSGTITKYDSIDDEEPDIPKYADVQAVLPNRTKESYLGYSVITGFFDDTSSEWVAAGAPRYMLMGAVVVYKPQDNSATFHDHVTLMGHPSKRQLGAYFGGSVLTADVNNDGKDDLFVGSPLYVASNYDEGRVFVYVSRPTNSLQAWGKDSYEPLELFGDHLPGGRFGTAMANAGDLNMDGYNDVIVGAPLTEVDRGAVFVYHGNENGVDTQFAQKILASELKGVQLKYFGQSLQGGVDLDGNKYPDIAVGAPKSDTVVIFRSRPVVKIDATIEYLTGDIDIFECIDKNYQNCSRIQVCFTASGTSVETVVGIRFNVTLDIEKAGATKRIEFRKSPDLIASGLPTWTQDLHLAKDNRTCLTKNIHMKSNIADYDSAIKTELEFDLLSSHTEKPLSSVRDPSKVNVKSTLLNFAKRCGNDDKCIHDLRLEASLSLPEYRTESDNKDLTENGKVLIVDQKTADVPVTVKVNLTNNGENAFDTKIKVMYTSLISLSTLDNRQAKPPSNSCIVEDSDPVDVGNGMKSQIFRYNYRTNIMRQYAWCYFEFNLITENLRSNGNLETFTVNVTAFTSDSSSSSSEKNEADNSWGLSPKVKYRSDFSLIKKSVTEIPFNYTSEEYNITSVHEIGGNTPDFEVAFEIRGEGYSNIPEAEATLTYPMKTSQGDMLLYLYKVECKPKSINSKASCSCHQDFVNIHNLTLENPNGNNTDGSYVTITPPEYQIEAKTFNCFNTDPGRNFTCAALQCNIKNLRDSDQMDFIAHFRLWSSSIMFNGTNFTEVELHSRYEVNTVKSPYIIDEKGDVSQMQTEEIITKAKKFAESEGTGTQKDYLWIIILAAVGGLLLLIAIVLILWKVGFFKSKYADMKKDAQDDVADESDIQGNGNESTTDMVG